MRTVARPVSMKSMVFIRLGATGSKLKQAAHGWEMQYIVTSSKPW